jgi:ABC-type branched-subunit amino acid transport system ATPase component
MNVPALLDTDALCINYGHVRVVHGVNISVHPGEIVSLVGPNGAGKTTTLLAVAGVLRPTSGEMNWKGAPMHGSIQHRVKSGLGFVTEERAVFNGLSVRDNLTVARVKPSKVFTMFPELEMKARNKAGELSGGQQQMLALGMTLAASPSLLLIDELSMGLAPQVVTRLLDALRVAAEHGCGILLVEQQAARAVQVADRVYVMQRGEIVVNGPASDFADIELLERSYFDAAGDDE